MLFVRDELKKAAKELRVRPAYAADILRDVELLLADILTDLSDVQLWMTEAQLGDTSD